MGPVGGLESGWGRKRGGRGPQEDFPSQKASQAVEEAPLWVLSPGQFPLGFFQNGLNSGAQPPCLRPSSQGVELGSEDILQMLIFVLPSCPCVWLFQLFQHFFERFLAPSSFF